MTTTRTNARRADAATIPPTDPQAEAALLGCLIVGGVDDQSAQFLREARDTGLTAGDFSDAGNAAIYSAVAKIIDATGGIDVIQLRAAFDEKLLAEVGGMGRLTALAEGVPVAHHAANYARIVRELAGKRWAMDAGYRLTQRASNGATTDDLRAMLGEVFADGMRRLGGADDAGLIRLADVQAEPVRWLWPGRIALGKMTLLYGDPGLGKSFLTLDLASRVSTGLGWPDAPGERFTPGGVVLLSAEDDLADTIRPRLDAAGADCARIVALQSTTYDLSRDLPVIDRAIESVADCRLVIVDPISAYLGDTDSHKAADVRAMLTPLSALASARSVAVLIVGHLNKGQGQALYRATGSLSFIAAARAAWLITRDKMDDSRRLLIAAKNNIGKDRSGLAFKLDTPMGLSTPNIRWEAGAIEMSADDALESQRPNPGPDPDARRDAEDFLRGALANGPRPAKELTEEWTEGEGGSKVTLDRARKGLAIVAYRDAIPGPWKWRMP